MQDFAAALQEFLDFSPGDRTGVRVFYAPGRVNLIGEHLDYNGGLVLPAALSLGVWLFTRQRAGGLSRFASRGFPGVFESSVADVGVSVPGQFANYPKGVCKVMGAAGRGVPPAADFYYVGSLPSGAGLASSAAVEVVTAVALNALWGEPFSMLELVRMAQEAENAFVGVQSGIMDQFAVGLGREGHAILLDTRSLGYQYVAAPLRGQRLVITHSGVERQLAGSKYNERREECQRALAEIRTFAPEVACLADCDGEGFVQGLGDLTLRKRLRHVVAENRRVSSAVQALGSEDLERFGRLMSDSHRSLRDDYEVTGPALDALVEAAWDVPGCLGSRMTGAGFGGCTVSLVREEAAQDFERLVAERYRQSTGLEPRFYVSSIAAGARELTHEMM